MKYDDASWHYGGDFPAHLPAEAGSTHIAMFVVWCLLNDLGGDLHLEDFREDFEDLKNRELTPGVWFRRCCDEKFTDEDLSDLGNEFARYYYDSEDPPYNAVYEVILCGNIESIYEVPDTWYSFDTLSPAIVKDYDLWRGDA